MIKSIHNMYIVQTLKLSNLSQKYKNKKNYTAKINYNFT